MTIETMRSWISRERLSAWWTDWFCEGMVVCATTKGVFEVRSLKRSIPKGLEAVGCGGWGADGSIGWVGLDLDVGHGSAQYASLDLAVVDACRVRDFVGGAAEIRRSKSGVGLHVRIRLAQGVGGGRSVAPLIAKWLACRLDVAADGSPLGRQNFWFWTAASCKDSFALIEPCVGFWMPPKESRVAPKRPLSQVVQTQLSSGREFLSFWTRDFLLRGAPEGERNHRLFCAAADMCGCGMTESESAALLLPAAVSCGLLEIEARHAVRSAFSKPRTPSRKSTIVVRSVLPGHSALPAFGRFSAPLELPVGAAVRIARNAYCARKVVGIDRIAQGCRSTVYRIRLDGFGPDIAVRLGSLIDAQSEVWGRSVAQSGGVYVPRTLLVAQPHKYCEHAVLVSEWVEGESLGVALAGMNSAQAGAVGKHLARLLRRLHSIHGHHFCLGRTDRCTFRSTTWGGMHEPLLDELARIPLANDFLGAERIEKLRESVRRLAACAAFQGVPVFVHGDLHCQNILVKKPTEPGMKLVLLDFDHSGFSSPIMDWAVLSKQVTDRHAALRAGIESECKRLAYRPWAEELQQERGVLLVLNALPRLISFLHEYNDANPIHQRKKKAFLKLWTSALSI